MPPSEKKRPSLSIKDKNIPASEQMPYKKQTRGKLPSYKIQNEFPVYPNLKNLLRSIMLIILIGN